MNNLENHMVLPHAEPEDREPTNEELSLEREVAKLESLMSGISTNVDYLTHVIDQAPQAPPANASPGALVLWFHNYEKWRRRLDAASSIMP
jgi:hypothetical protein